MVKPSDRLLAHRGGASRFGQNIFRVGGDITGSPRALGLMPDITASVAVWTIFALFY